MEDGPRWFRELHLGLMTADTRSAQRGLLEREAGGAAEALSGLARLQTRPPRRPVTERVRTDAEQLAAEIAMYALGRTSHYLLEPGGPAGPAPEDLGESGGRCLSRSELAVHDWFCEAIGLARIDDRPGFSPFHHEVFAVTTDETVDEITVEQVLWPGYRWGDLLFSRAGVHVRAPRRLVDPVVATTSTLRFTHRRQPRNTHDPSHGWGSNSQWRTPCRLFYDDADGLHVNWNAEIDIAVDHPGPRGAGSIPTTTAPPSRRGDGPRISARSSGR